MAERLALPTLDPEVTDSNPVEGETLPEPKWPFIAQSLSCSPFYCPDMIEILLKGSLFYPKDFIGTDLVDVRCSDYRNDPKFSDRYTWANSVDPDQTAPSPRGAV